MTIKIHLYQTFIFLRSRLQSNFDKVKQNMLATQLRQGTVAIVAMTIANQ